MAMECLLLNICIRQRLFMRLFFFCLFANPLIALNALQFDSINREFDSIHKLANNIRVAEAVAKLAAQDVSLQYTVSHAVRRIHLHFACGIILP
jgi:hypothetical protein